MRARLVWGLLTFSCPALALGQLQVVSHSPSLNAFAGVGTTVAITFDQPLNTATVNSNSFRVWGQWSGPAIGTLSFSNGDQTATLTPNQSFSAGELVFVNLSHDITSAAAAPLRAQGYAFQFITSTIASTATFREIDRFSNKTGHQTRIYGAAAADLNNDDYLDLATINEVSADVRVFLNLADGSGLFDNMLSPQGIGVEASPNQPADFNNDGNIDLCVAAADSGDVWILLGAGDGTFSSVTGIEVGSQPHGIQPIDVDGDGDLDIVNANVGSNNLSLLINNGAGVFGAPTFFEGGVHGEYGLAAADMNADGITDLVVAGRDGSQIATMLGNGNGTFTAAAAAVTTGGSTWVVVLGDVNNDGKLDAVTANDGDGNIGILLGQGDGTFAAVSTIEVGSHVPSVDLGDLDGDGDLDIVVSSFGGQFWRWFRNNGAASFTVVDSFPAPANPSCAVLFDFDNDGDLDMALTDEIADVVVLMENGDTSSCSLAPRNCREPLEAKKSQLTLKDNTPADDRDGLSWSLRSIEATSKAELGNPLGIDAYALCLYEDETLVQGFDIPPAGTCSGKPCWKDITKGYSYKDKDLTPDGIGSVMMIEGLVDGKTKVKIKGKGTRLGMADLMDLDGVLKMQLQRTNDTLCWGATYSPPFKKQEADVLKAYSDAPTTLSPVWSEIYAQVIGTGCPGCHPSAGGLSLADCNSAYTNLFNVPSTRLPTMDRVEAGSPTTSWLMHKLDGTQGMFTAQCASMSCGSQMPLGGPFLETEVLDTIRTWILNGAVNDCP